MNCCRNWSLIRMATPARRVEPCDQKAFMPSLASSAEAALAFPAVEWVSETSMKSWVRRIRRMRVHLSRCLATVVWNRPWAFQQAPLKLPVKGMELDVG